MFLHELNKKYRISKTKQYALCRTRQMMTSWNWDNIWCKERIDPSRYLKEIPTLAQHIRRAVLNVHKHLVAAARSKMEASELFLSKFVKPINRPSAFLKAETDGVVVLDQSVFARKKTKLRRRPRKKLSRSAIKQLGLYALPQDTIQYKDAVKLHAIWCTYMEKLIEKAGCAYNVKDMRYNTLVGVLLKADFHGAKVSVVRSKQSSVIGVKGIVILDTKGTFKIVSKDNKIRTIPKNDSQFEVYTNESVISIFGKFLTYRPAERSTRKLKIFSTPDL